MSEKFCVFCGKNPEGKTREHILPQWLIELTGEPTRTVNFGINYEEEKTISFAWSQFVVPACEKCNSDYSDLESKVKPLIEETLSRNAVTAKDWIVILNWLDKVRVGLWLAYHLLQKNPTKVEPTFFINDRVNTKDRMVCVYPIKNNRDGLNGFGAETLLFHRTPSCIALRINDVILLNMSSDYLFSNRCGFPYPKERKVIIEKENNGLLFVSDFKCSKKIKHPIIREKIFKPSIQLYQPIMQKDINGDYPHVDETLNYMTSGFINKHTISEEEGHGVLFRQYKNRITPVFDKDALIEFDDITQKDSKPLYKILAQVYDFQIHCHKLNTIHSTDKAKLKEHVKNDNLLIKINKTLKSRHLHQANVQN